MTPEELDDRATRVFGTPRWRRKLALATGKNYATVKRWAAGDLPVPEYVATILTLMEKESA